MTTVALHLASATTLAALIRAREASSVEVVEACLRRIEAVNPRINAVVRFADGALDAARAADAILRTGAPVGPLHGVPYTLKDSIDTAGIVTTAGTIGWRERVPTRDATVAARLRAAGAILLGKTNTPEFTWSDETANEVYGRTANPYDLARTSGGSSGGSAAIVAAAGSPFDIGSDTGDSIRAPSHFCGVAGLKPTQGRVPRTGHSPSFHGILGSWTQLGPIARAVEDLALVLPIIAGPDGVDPHVQPIPLRDPAGVDVGSLRVAVFTDNGVLSPTSETVTAVRAAAAALSDAGARVEERLPDGLADLPDLYERIVHADGHAWLRRLIAAAGTPGDGSYRWLVNERTIPVEELTDLLERLDAVRSRVLRAMADLDLIVCPATPGPAFPHGGEPTAKDTYSEPHNLTGMPSGVVRAGTSPEGLPIGVQLAARHWREDVVLASATVVETRLGGWRAPPLFA